ncbi:hypothetical protein [Shrimp hemocyte iridescent virus]|uniref:Uncharacterized protein n=1 Tax=Shrimp hemocyte iridescent virus TaxID=2039780 RepID=A0A291B0Z4_9VIRU|nr:hypothetical protein KM509_gp160 [Shrimp hemocyte iridescent virus]ATE87169.1 hypothetical protein [Shrimp hemocyte iridescent virus]
MTGEIRLKMNLFKIGNDECSIEDFNNFIQTYIENKQTCLDVIKSLKHKFNLDDIEFYFECLKPFMEMFGLKLSEIYKFSSHMFCRNCALYKPSSLHMWIYRNSELFEMEIPFYYKFVNYFSKEIKSDVSAYPSEDILFGEDKLYPGQVNKEKLKILNFIVKHYDFILEMLDLNSDLLKRN